MRLEDRECLVRKWHFLESDLCMEMMARQELYQVVDVHNQTLNVLLNGGEVPGFDYSLSKTSDKEIRNLIESKVMPFWSSYYASFQIILDTNKSIDIRKQALASIELSANEMLRLNNDLVQMYSKHSITDQGQMNRVIGLILLANLVTIMLVFRISRSYSKEKNKALQINNNLLTSEEELRSQQEELNAILDDLSDKNYQLGKDKIILEIIQKISGVGYWELDVDSLDIKNTNVLLDLYGDESSRVISLRKSLDCIDGGSKLNLKKAFDKAIAENKEFDLVLPFLKKTKLKGLGLG